MHEKHAKVTQYYYQNPFLLTSGQGRPVVPRHVITGTCGRTKRSGSFSFITFKSRVQCVNAKVVVYNV